MKTRKLSFLVVAFIHLTLVLLCSCKKQEPKALKTSVVGIEFDEYFDESFAVLSEQLTLNGIIMKLNEPFGTYSLSESIEGQQTEVELYFLYGNYNSLLQDYANEKPVKNHHLGTFRKVWKWGSERSESDYYPYVKKVYEYLIGKYGEPYEKSGLDVYDINKTNGIAEWRRVSLANPDIELSFKKDHSGAQLILYQVNPDIVDYLY